MMKAPHPGKVKTRLGAEIGEQKATLLYRRFVEFLCTGLLSIESPHWDTVIAFDPVSARDEISEWLSPLLHKGILFEAQCQGDLGARLEDQFIQAFESGAPSALALGTDCLALSIGEIETCFKNLNKHDVVLGEAYDGGYWCIGMSGPHYGLFRNMPWSQSQLCELTRRKALELGLKLTERSKLRDIDQLEDLFHLPRSLRNALAVDELIH